MVQYFLFQKCYYFHTIFQGVSEATSSSQSLVGFFSQLSDCFSSHLPASPLSHWSLETNTCPSILAAYSEFANFRCPLKPEELFGFLVCFVSFFYWAIAQLALMISGHGHKILEKDDGGSKRIPIKSLQQPAPRVTRLLLRLVEPRRRPIYNILLRKKYLTMLYSSLDKSTKHKYVEVFI